MFGIIKWGLIILGLLVAWNFIQTGEPAIDEIPDADTVMNCPQQEDGGCELYCDGDDWEEQSICGCACSIE